MYNLMLVEKLKKQWGSIMLPRCFFIVIMILLLFSRMILECYSN